MEKLNIFDKLFFGLAMVLLALVAFAEIFPALWALLPSRVIEAKFSGADIGMIMLTFGIVFFAGVQAFLQWRHHKFEREIESNKWKLALHKPRAEIYKFCFEGINDIKKSERPTRESITEFNNFMIENQHYLSQEVQDYVSEIYHAQLKLFNNHETALKAEDFFRVNPTATAEERKSYEDAVLEMKKIDAWYKKQNGYRTLRGHFDKILTIPDNL